MNNSQFKLSLKDRLILANQYRILERVDPEEAKFYRDMRTIVESGYEGHYTELHQHTLRPPLPESESDKVMMILRMYHHILLSYNLLADKEEITLGDVQFPGFDNHGEGDYLFFARFVVLTQGCWEKEILEGRPDFDLDSHSPRVATYFRMLEKYKSMCDVEVTSNPPLSIEQIRDIINT